MKLRSSALASLVLVAACSSAAVEDDSTGHAKADLLGLGDLLNVLIPPPPPPGRGEIPQGAFTEFETGQVRPLALSPNGHLLFATNTPANRLEVFRVDGAGLTPVASIPVGLEPLAVAALSDSEVWVVNHLSDSVSIIRVDGSGSGRVVRTLHVGDEPRDIVFAGSASARRAFITTAHRGQNNARDPQLTTPGVGRADVWVFDVAEATSGSLGGTPLAVLTLFTDTPRALAVTPDGTRVYVAGFHTGNQTTSLTEFTIPDGFDVVPPIPPGDPLIGGGVPGPAVNHEGALAPEVGIIVKYDGTHWRDTAGKIWDDHVRFFLPDKDVFTIDATATPPRPIADATGTFAGVGTILFNMVVNPVNGKVYVSNLESRNDHRFEGPGIFMHGETLRGHLAENRISVLDPAAASTGRVAPRHLNKHIDYGHCCDPIPNDENGKSLAFPLDMKISADGSTLYVAAFGSSKVGIYPSGELEADTFVPSTSRQVTVTGGGPSGLALDEARGRLYVLTRFDNGVSVVDTHAKTEMGHVRFYNPEPQPIKEGRRFLYDATLTSSHGDQACASCHIFGDFDSLAWNLGNPDGDVLNNPGPFTDDLVTSTLGAGFPLAGRTVIAQRNFHPMKGPMSTQSLRGMANSGAMHWRGDRTGGNDAETAQPNSGSFDEVAAFLKFNPAFQSLLGANEQLSEADMRRFAEFILSVTYPPNPIRNLDNSLTPDQTAGRRVFHEQITDPHPNSCQGCHQLNPSANLSDRAPGFFGTDGQITFEFETQLFKIPHLRNLYQKVGKFGFPNEGLAPVLLPDVDHQFMGDQIRGFGFLHDGSFDTINRFISLRAFIFPPDPLGSMQRRQIEQFLLAFDSNMAPVVGQQVTFSTATASSAPARINLLRARAEAFECDLVAKLGGGSTEEGFFYVRASDNFRRDRQAAPALSEAGLRQYALSRNEALTYTCVPPGSGQRIGIDRDADGALDGDEIAGGSNPDDPASTP
jgi:DNA-binding beta-propeller fold protein YncE